MTPQDKKKAELVTIRHQSYKLGKLPPKIDPRTFKLEKYLTNPLPDPPAQNGYVKRVANWGMMLNDQLGDCTCACPGHQILQWSTYAGHPFRPSDADILTAYEAVSGYVPGDPFSDNGAYSLDVLKYWRKTGIGDHKILAFASVNWRDHRELKQAINLFGSVYLGVEMPLTAQSPAEGGNGHWRWTVPPGGPVGDAAPGSWGGHVVPIMEYDNPFGVEAISWGDVYDMGWGFLNAYADEAFVVLSQDWIDTNGLSVSGFSLAQLQTDLAQL